MKTLVVDDTKTNRQLLTWILEDSGHQVVEAANGQEAVECYQNDPPDLVLLDVMMPVMDGYEAARQIKKLAGEKHIPIIFLTALTDEQSLTKCLSVGGDDFLTKPFNEDILQAKIKAHTRIKELNDQISEKNAELMKHRNNMLREQQIAQRVFQNAMSGNILTSKNTRSYISAATTFNGDLLLTTVSPSGGLYALLADFTGHGLPAAIGALPVSQVFYDTTRAGKPVSDIARDLNRSLEGFLPEDMFAAAHICELNAAGTRLTVWSGGMPDAYVLDSSGKICDQIQSKHMPLGVLKDHEFERDVKVVDVVDGCTLYLYTDGITESLNPAGDMYGEERLRDILQNGSQDPFNCLINDLTEFHGQAEQDDDITLVEILCTPVEVEIQQAETSDDRHSVPWSLCFNLGPDDFRNSMPIAQIIDMVGETPGVGPHKDYLHTILSELYSNSLEHGILQLESKLKHTEEGYLEYYTLRESRLQELAEGEISINLQLINDNGGRLIKIQLNDSGCGFDYTKLRSMNDNDSFGRGLPLMYTLCEQVEYSNGGRRVELTYRLR